MSFIAAIPAFLSLFYLLQSVEKAFLRSYISTLLIFPTYYNFRMPALPDPNFVQSAILPIFGFWLFKGMPGYRFSPLDILVVIYALIVGYSEFVNLGFDEAQNIMFDMFASVLFPYFLAKSLIVPYKLSLAFAKWMVIVGGLTLIISLSQYLPIHHYYTIYQLALGPYFGYQGWAWPARYRNGLPRISGPFGHAIIAGMIFSSLWLLSMWVKRNGGWPKRIPKLEWLPINLGLIISAFLFIGVIAPQSRGPLVGAILGAVIAMTLARTKKRWQMFGIMLTALIILAIPTSQQFVEYASVSRAEAGYGTTQETVAYRWHLIGSYIEVGSERLWLGWGSIGWPMLPGQKSIDNHYLLLFLMHGLIAVASFFSLILITSIRLFWKAMTEPLVYPEKSSLGFFLLGILILFTFSIATVSLAFQTLPLFFIFLGWSEAYLLFGQDSDTQQQTVSQSTTTVSVMPFSFRRVLQ